ncbi:alpha/beta hydrolase, partial [bacterium]|nr:alpha/beta hydrolase [bacterium]
MGKVDIWSMAFQEVRKLINQLIMRVHADVPCVDAIEDCSVIGTTGHVPVRVYRMRHEGAQPAIMLIHGGAWVAGDLETHDNLARYLCVKSDAVVLSVGYTNAPEGKFPLPLEQCNDVLNWMVDQAAALGIDPARIAVAGDSAGGNLAAALCLLVR